MLRTCPSASRAADMEVTHSKKTLYSFISFCFWCFLDGDYNDDDDEAIPDDIDDDDDEDNPNKIVPMPKSSAFFIFSHTNRWRYERTL